MRLFAEEFKLGTIEPLTTAPVHDWQVVLSKFFGALVFYLILWIPTLLYFWIFARIANQPAAHSVGAYFGSYLMLLLLGMFYLSIGCLTSVLTRNQIIARLFLSAQLPVIFSVCQFILLMLRLQRAICWLLLRDRTDGDILGRNRYPADRAHRHDRHDADATYQAFQSRKWRL
jgi:ABC-type transport system involved in multi-copper enzyme maturation permease subunit